MAIWVLKFKGRDTKVHRFLARNQHSNQKQNVDFQNPLKQFRSTLFVIDNFLLTSVFIDLKSNDYVIIYFNLSILNFQTTSFSKMMLNFWQLRAMVKLPWDFPYLKANVSAENQVLCHVLWQFSIAMHTVLLKQNIWKCPKTWHKTQFYLQIILLLIGKCVYFIIFA